VKIRIGGWKRWLLIGIVGGALLLVGGPFVYIHFIEGKAPAPLSLTTDPSSTESQAAGDGTSGSRASVDGAWNITTGSQVGYRIKETLFGQSNTAVGRTNSVTGSIVISDATVTSGSFTVDMTTVTSDQSRRDGQFQGRIMDTATYPTATFKLTKPIALDPIPADSVSRSASAAGDLTIHGATRTVTFTVTGRRSGSTFQVNGSIPVVFADYNIVNPSFGPAQTEDHGTLEFLLVFSRT
jgi:polyisoprenoid-binding protein YceI